MAIDKIRRKNGTAYRARVCMPNGRRKSRCFDRKVDAEAWEAKTKLEKKGLSQRTRIRFGELAERFIENHARPMMAFSSFQKYQAALRLYIVPEFEKTWIDEISKMQIVEFRTTVETLDLSSNMKHFIFTAFKTVMRKALEWDLLDRNPSDGVSSPKKGTYRTAYWKGSEVTQFLDANRASAHLPLFLIALNSGMRVGEILGMKWDCVDLENGIITVRRIYCQKSNGVKETTKTGRVRQIGINAVLKTVLVQIKQTNSNSEFVLGDQYRNRGYHFSRLMAQASKKANIRPLKFHDLRHTFATQFVMNGGSIHALSGTLGHTSTTMTARYAHFGPDHAKKAAQVVSFSVPENGNVIPLHQHKQEKAK